MKKIGVASPHARLPNGVLYSHPAGKVPNIVSLILDGIVKQRNKRGLA
jgi:hypothetical protein